MKKVIAIVFLFLFLLNFGNAQNVAINADGTNANADAILHLKSTSQGLLIPSMTTSQRTSISNVSDGLMVYDTQTNSFWFRDSGTWIEIVSGDIELTILEDADSNTKIQVEEGDDDDVIRFDIDGVERVKMLENVHGSFRMEIGDPLFNTFIGENAGANNDPNITEGRLNCFVGYEAGQYNETGSFNTFFGASAGELCESGKDNVGLGYAADFRNIDGQYNTTVGSRAGLEATSTNNNTLIGYKANEHNQTGSNNTIIGYQAGANSSLHSKSGNVFLGYQAGYSESSDNKLYIDNSSTTKPLVYGDFSSNELQSNGDFYVNENSASNSSGQLFFKVNDANKFSLGYETANDYFVIKDEVNNDRVLYIKDGKIGVQRSSPSNDFEVNGTASKSTAGDWLANSDARLKKNITALSSSEVLQKMLKLKGVTYEWDDQVTGNDRPEGIQYGFTAQNIQEVFPDLVSEDDLGYLQTAYGTYDAMYIESIRALLAKIETLETKIERFENLEARLNILESANGLNASK